jgi:hypothetical protein
MKTEIRFSFNPFNNDFLFDNSNLSHAEKLYKEGKQKNFYEYIRGIIIDNNLYLRLYYPFNDIENLSITELKQKSFSLLKDNKKEILKQVKKHFKIDILEIVFNADNDLLSGKNLANI